MVVGENTNNGLIYVKNFYQYLQFLNILFCISSLKNEKIFYPTKRKKAGPYDVYKLKDIGIRQIHSSAPRAERAGITPKIFPSYGI